MTHDHVGHEHVSMLRLLMPQWQGGGNQPAYHLGGRLLAWLAPPSTAMVEEVAIDLRSEGLAWLRSTGASHVAVHFDLDVLEPQDFRSTIGHDPNGLRVAAAIRLLGDVARVVDDVGLGITEYAPRDALLLADMLRQLPIVSDA